MSTAQPDFASVTFKTSSYTSENGTCVEVARVPGFVAVRDTKNRAGGYVAVSSRAFAELTAAVKSDS